MNIAAVVLNYNGYDDTIACVESLRKSAYACRIIVVDNASAPADCNNLSRFLSGNEELICSEINGGYTGGMNIGIDYAFKEGNDAVLVFNNDIIVDSYCIGSLVDSLQADPKIGIIGPKALYYDKPDTINYAGISGNLEGGRFDQIGKGLPDSNQFEDLIPTFYQEGSALMITRACYEQIGGFDTALWSYWEDTDISIRARLAGFKVMCNQSAKIWHKISSSFGTYYDRSPLSVYYRTRNRFLVYRRYAADGSQASKAIARALARSLKHTANLLIRSKRHRLSNTGAYWSAVWDGITSDVNKPRQRYLPQS